MRNPKRINEFCNRLKAAWSAMPDMRFGQLIENVNDFIASGFGIFYIEDDKLIERIEEYVAEIQLEMKE